MTFPAQKKKWNVRQVALSSLVIITGTNEMKEASLGLEVRTESFSFLHCSRGDIKMLMK